MPRLVRNQTLNELEEAVFLLRDQLAVVAPDVLDDSAAGGCCGCGAWMCDVRTPSDPMPPHRSEGYCWSCVDSHNIAEYAVLFGRQRDLS